MSNALAFSFLVGGTLLVTGVALLADKYVDARMTEYCAAYGLRSLTLVDRIPLHGSPLRKFCYDDQGRAYFPDMVK